MGLLKWLSGKLQMKLPLWEGNNMQLSFLHRLLSNANPQNLLLALGIKHLLE
jgi:hypothetical protein